MTVKKLNVKKLGIVIGLFLVIILIIIFSFRRYMDDKREKETYEYKFGQIGYSTEEITVLKEMLDNSQLDKLLGKEYDEKYVDLVKEEYFDFDKLEDYIAYSNENKDAPIQKVIAIVNVGADKDWYENVKETDTSKGNLMIVNKFYGLPSDYEPELVLVSSTYAYANKYVSSAIYDDLVGLLDAARGNGFTLVVSQGYRSYAEQEETYNNYKSSYSTREADEFVARPGHSEYQTGLGVDIEPYNKNVEDVTQSAEHKWLINNAYKYGFILRYEEGKEDITGFDANNWRFRYVGRNAALQIHDKGLTFDEYYEYYVK